MKQDLSRNFDVPAADLQWASPPCPPWSFMNMHGPCGLDTHLGRLMLQLPVLFVAGGAKVMVIEQSPNMLHVHKGRDWMNIKEAFECCGGKVEHYVLDASEYGLKQKRKRLYIVVSQQSLGFSLPVLKKRSSLPLRFDKAGIRAVKPRSKTICAHSGGGDRPYAFKNITLQNGSIRELTMKDMASLQGVPRAFRFPNAMSASKRQLLLGNAVPPLMAKLLLKAVCDGLHAIGE